MRKLTPGAVALIEYIELRGLSSYRAAAKMGIAGPLMHGWTAGKCRPDCFYREVIALWTGGAVTPDMWFSKEEKELFLEVRPYRHNAHAAA